MTATRAHAAIAAALGGGVGRVVRHLELPELGAVALRLLTRTEERAVDRAVARTRRALARRYGAAIDHAERAVELAAGHTRAVQTLALAVGAPVTGAPIGSAAEWAELPRSTIDAAWSAYVDLVAELDPLRHGLEPDAREALEAIDLVDRLRCTHAAALREYFGAPARDLLDTDVIAWAVAVEEITLRAPGESPRRGGALANADDLPGSLPLAEEDAPPVEEATRAGPR